jgi:hypothetical protein
LSRDIADLDSGPGGCAYAAAAPEDRKLSESMIAYWVADRLERLESIAAAPAR